MGSGLKNVSHGVSLAAARMSTVVEVPVRRQACVQRQTLDREHTKIVSGFLSVADEVEYYKDTAHILFHYYNAVEKGNPVAPAVPGDDCPGGGRDKRRSVLDMLNDIGASADVLSHDPLDDYLAERRPAGACAEALAAGVATESPYMTMTRGELLESFLETIHGSTGARRAAEPCVRSCAHCGCAEMVTVSREAICVCPACDSVEEAMIESDKPGFKDNQKFCYNYFCYKRSNHFQEWISQTQGREHTSIPDHVYDQILTELKKQKFENMAALKVRKLKEVMKKLHLNRYFEHISHILCHINGTPVVNMPPELEVQLRRMFQLIQAPFLQHAPKSRKNFLSYSYVLHKFLQLLGEDEYIVHFPLLKSRQKLHAQDVIWRKICETLRWEFIPSL